MLMLAPKSQIASLKFTLPMEIGMIVLPRSPFLIERVSSFQPIVGTLQFLPTLKISTRFADSSSSSFLGILPWHSGGIAVTS
jgi:hypothetical protein